MRILFLSAWHPWPPDNGSKLRVYHLLRALAARHAVTLLSFAWDTARPEDATELRAWCSQIRTVPLDPFAANRASSLRTFLSPIPLYARPLALMVGPMQDLLAEGRFDAVVSSTLAMSAYALQAPPSTIRVLEEHNSLTRWMRERYESAHPGWAQTRCWFAWQKARRFEARRFSQFDLVTMVSDQDRQAAQELVGADKGRVRVVPNGVDCTHNRPGLATTRPNRLVFNGSLTYYANHDAMRWFLAEIYPRIRAQVPGVSLTITGSTKGVNTAGWALDPSVRLTGFVEDVRLPVAEAAACVVPIRQGGGTRLKILEAMALGTPVVATSKAAEGLDVTDGEHLRLADDAESFARLTSGLLGNPGLRTCLADNARRLVAERYDWQTIGAGFVDLVDTTVREREGKAV
jgi:glycosyltransferase involved in cell wall biosynthesis